MRDCICFMKAVLIFVGILVLCTVGAAVLGLVSVVYGVYCAFAMALCAAGRAAAPAWNHLGHLLLHAGACEECRVVVGDYVIVGRRCRKCGLVYRDYERKLETAG